METANIPQTNSTVEVESFTFFYSLTDKNILANRVQVVEIGCLKVQGFAKRYPNELGEIVIQVDIKQVRLNGTEVGTIFTHFRDRGLWDDLQAAAERYVRTVTFAPRPTKEAVLSAIVETVISLKEFEPLTFLNPLTIRLSDSDHHIVTVAGLLVTVNTRQLIVLQGDGEGWPLEATDAGAERMIAEIYKRLEKLFPEQVKAIA